MTRGHRSWTKRTTAAVTALLVIAVGFGISHRINDGDDTNAGREPSVALQPRGDLVVTYDAVGSSDVGPPPSERALITKLERVAGVARVAPASLWSFPQLRLPDGAPPALGPLAIEWRPTWSLELTAGRAPRARHEIAINQTAARRMRLAVGDHLTVDPLPRTSNAGTSATSIVLVGVFRQDGSPLSSLTTVAFAAGRVPPELYRFTRRVAVLLEGGADPTSVRKRLAERLERRDLSVMRMRARVTAPADAAVNVSTPTVPKLPRQGIAVQRADSIDLYTPDGVRMGTLDGFVLSGNDVLPRYEDPPGIVSVYRPDQPLTRLRLGPDGLRPISGNSLPLGSTQFIAGVPTAEMVATLGIQKNDWIAGSMTPATLVVIRHGKPLADRVVQLVDTSTGIHRDLTQVREVDYQTVGVWSFTG